MTTVAGRIGVRRLHLFLLEAPIETPVRTSFAAMTKRPALLVRVEDADAAFGWGEIWCNHPPFAGRHRLRLAADVLGPLLLSRDYGAPSEAARFLHGATRAMTLQCGEPGPFAQVIAGIDTALWDLAARRADVPLARHLAGDGCADAVPAYASGINPDEAEARIEAARNAGFGTFKIKVGFDRDADRAAVAAVAGGLGAGERFMVDANQAWDLDAAMGSCARLAELSPAWIEEPMAADAPNEDWECLARAVDVPLAGGENLLKPSAFDRAVDGSVLRIIQPDVAKWGGVSGCLGVARRAVMAGKVYCPHFLGAAPGLMASAHLLAAAGGDGLLEVDLNPNPLREHLAQAALRVDDGSATLPTGPGIGFDPDPAAMEEFLVESTEVVGPR